MTDHLPECPVERMLRNGKTVGSQTCICSALRSCEARMRESEACLAVCADSNYMRGLDAAREAVAALLAYDSPYGPLIRTMAALAAIDALRENRETPPPLPPSVGVPERRWT